MRHETIEIDGYSVTITYHEETSGFLQEAKHKGIPLIGSYSYFHHQRHTPDGDYHLHVYDVDNQIFAINKGGPAHDGFHGVRIPNKVYKELSKRFSDWKFPPSKIIETVNYVYLLNSTSGLNYKELICEVNILNNERTIIENFTEIVKSKVQPILEHVTADQLDSQSDEIMKRIKALYIELYTRI